MCRAALPRSLPIRTPPAPGYRFFTRAEARFVEAACDCLIPADRAGAGALEAGAPGYLDAQFSGDWGCGRSTYRSGPWQPGTPASMRAARGGAPARTPAEAFRAGLSGVLRHLDRSRIDFAAEPPPSQRRYLHRLQRGAVTLEGASSAEFFDTLLAMTVEGFFSHPRLGATRDRVQWRLRGFPGACAHRV